MIRLEYNWLISHVGVYNALFYYILLLTNLK